MVLFGYFVALLMSIFVLPLELRCSIYDELSPSRYLNTETIRGLFKSHVLHINRHLRHEAIEHFIRAKELCIPTLGSGPLFKMVDSAMLAKVTKLRFQIKQLVATFNDSQGNPTLHISDGMNALPIIATSCEKAVSAREICISIEHICLERIARSVRINLAGVITHCVPLFAKVTVEAPPSTRHLTGVESAVQECEKAIREGLSERQFLSLSVSDPQSSAVMQ